MKGIYDPEDSYFRPLSFEEQFTDIRRVGGGREIAKYVDVRPENWSEKPPILLIGDWSANLHSLKGLGQTLYENSRRVLIVDFTESSRSTHNKEKMVSGEWIYSETVAKSCLLVETLIDARICKTDIIAHSEGALVAVTAAEYYNHFFNKLVLAMPAGMIGEDTLSKLIKRFLPKIARSLGEDMRDNPKIGLSANLEAISHIIKKPAKTLQETYALAHTTIDKTLHGIHNEKLKIGILQAYADPVFPENRIQENVRLGGFYANADAYGSLAAQNAGHDDLIINPHRSALAALQMLDSL